MKKRLYFIIFVLITFALVTPHSADAQWLWWKKDKAEDTQQDNQEKKRSLFNRQKSDNNKVWTLPFPAPRKTQKRQYQSQTLNSLESYGLDTSLAPEVALDKIANLDNGRQVAEANIAKIEAARQRRAIDRARREAEAQAQLLRQQALEAQGQGQSLPQQATTTRTSTTKQKIRPKIRPFIPKAKTESTDNKPRRLFNTRD